MPRVIEPKVNLDRNIVPLEDLSIFLDLVAVLPKRSIVKNTNLENTVSNLENISDGQKINFTFTRAPEGETPSLTTSWTNIGGKTEQKTSEGFGITNVDIQFDASFVPRVTIDFIDIRGAALFDAGKDSSYYNAFFHLPYPLFMLQFKGYYGDAVTYPLHLMKFNSKFNGETGNFEIKCEFIGHTFALLSDLLLGFALAAPYMTSGGSPSCCEESEYTIKDYIQITKKVTNQLEEIKKSDSFDKINTLTDLKFKMTRELPKLIDSKKKILSDSSDVKNFLTKQIISKKSGDNSINLFISRVIEEFNENLTEDLRNTINKFIAGSTNTGTNFTLNKEALLVNDKVQWGIYDKLLAAFNQTFKISLEKESAFISKATNKVLEDYNFKEEVKVKNVVNTLLCGYEIFLNRLKTISEQADDPAQQEERKRLFNTSDSVVESKTHIYPFPLYYQNVDGTPTIKFPGVNPQLSRIPEVIFVNDFIQALFNTKEDLNASNELLNAGDGWSPTNLLESPLMGNVTDPYSNMTYYEILNSLMSRVFVLLSYSYPLGLAVAQKTNKYTDKSYPDIVGKAAISSLKSWGDAAEFFNDDVTGMVSTFAEAEATIFFESKVNEKVIEKLLELKAEGLIDAAFSEFNVSSGKPLNSTNGNNTYMAKADNGLRVSTVKEHYDLNRTYYNNENQSDDERILYYCTNTPTTNVTTDVSLSAMTNVSLTINSNKIIYGNMNDGDVFELMSKSLVEDTPNPKNNEELSSIYDHWYAFGVDDKSEDFDIDRVHLTRFNVLGNTNNNNGEFGQIPWIGRVKGNYFEQGFGNREDYWNDKLIGNVKLESTDYHETYADGAGRGYGTFTDNPLLLNKSETFDINYGDFSFYIDTAYFGQIQDTNFYKLNNSLVTDFQYEGSRYDYKNTNTAYLFIQTLELDFLNEGYFNLFTKFGGLMKVPQAWSLWVGALLWRQDHLTTNTTILGGTLNIDPIEYGNPNGLAGTDIFSYTGNSRTALGVHFDYLANTSLGSKDLSEYLQSPVVAPGVSETPYDAYNHCGTNLRLVTSGRSQTYSYTSSKHKTTKGKILYTLFTLPYDIKKDFIELFLNWAQNGDARISMGWSAIKEIIEDKSRIKRHWFEYDLTYGISNGSDMRPPVGLVRHGSNVIKTQHYQVPLYDNVGEYPGYDLRNGTTNEDEFAKAYFVGGYFNEFLTETSFLIDDETVGFVPNGLQITQGGYSFGPTYSGSTNGGYPVKVYNKKIRFINDNIRNFLDLSQSYMYMVNGSWRNFLFRDESSTGSLFANDPLNQQFPTFYATQGTLSVYFTSFLKKLDEINTAKEDRDKEPPKNMLEDDDLKLDIYMKFKNLYDKWISTNLLAENKTICLSKYFSYRDRAMNDIGDKAIINPKSVMQLFDKSQNSLYNILYEMLSQNNFDFFPLPHFNGFGSDNDKINRMFENVLTIGETTYSPNFVCIFVGDRASTVDFGNSEFGNNVVDFDNESTVPSDIATSDNVGVFKVTFGLENQNIFKSISLDQSDYKETSESLQVIDDLSKSGGEANSIAFKGQDLFQVYNKRSYNCNVEMLGCSVIEPMTYFQLSNVPMFRGAYMIHQVSHNITPNHMSTNFTGVRIPFANIPVITDYAVAVGLLDNVLDQQNDSDGGIGTAGSVPVVVTLLSGTTEDEVYQANYKYGYSKVTGVDYLTTTVNTSKVDGSTYMLEDLLTDVSVLADVPLMTLKLMSLVESNNGRNKGNLINNQMNTYGFVGLMQMGKPATKDISAKMSTYINTEVYKYAASVNGKKINIPKGQSQWFKDDVNNNTRTNSMFDDFLNASGASELAKKNIDYLKSKGIKTSLSNFVDVYLCHQQGAGGLLKVLNNPQSNVERNQANNPPPRGGKVFRSRVINKEATMREWYIAWYGYIDGIAKGLDDTYNSPLIA